MSRTARVERSTAEILGGRSKVLKFGGQRR